MNNYRSEQGACTGFLYSTPSFLSGMGSVINLAGNYFPYNVSKSGIEADNLAIGNDFMIVGDDLRQAINEVCEIEVTVPVTQK